VFGWSFYSQGSHTTFTNSQPFFSAILLFLGIDKIPNDEIAKAQLLARCLRDQPCLLILDGLEPLQYAESLQSMNGELRDTAIKEFIAELRRTPCNSFVLFSSRQPLIELDNWQQSNYSQIDLGYLDDEAGALLLKERVKSIADDQLKKISHKLKGHALSLVLFGCLLSQHRKTHEAWKKILKLDVAESNNDEFHTFDILEYYTEILTDNELCFLHLLGLFDRPMSREEKKVLIETAQHAKPLRPLTVKQWQSLEQCLEKGGLLLGKKGKFEILEWDAHPIIRSYFEQHFKNKHKQDFNQAQSILFAYYQSLSEKYLPDTLEEMLPLYRATSHGCLAGEYTKAFEVYRARICRDYEYYSQHTLGAYAQELTALSAFFPNGWEQPIDNSLTEDSQAWIYAETSFCLMSLGHMQEAIEPREKHFNLFEKLKDWENAARAAQNLVDLYVAFVLLKQANSIAQKSVEYAQRSESSEQVKRSQSCLGVALHQNSNFREALECFEKAEKLAQLDGYDFLSQTYGFDYCCVLLEVCKNEADFQNLIKRAEYGLLTSKRKNHLICIAYYYLILARTYFISNNLFQTEFNFLLAIEKLQEAHAPRFIPVFYLARARFYLSVGKLEQAKNDLNIVIDTIEHYDIKIHFVEYLLVHGQYCYEINDIETAINNYEEAKSIIREKNYILYDAEIDLLAAQISYSCKESTRLKNTLYYINKAKYRINEIGQWRLIPLLKNIASKINN